jgi:hypothetical protein
MADALSESSKGDEWGKDIARKKISEMKFKLKLIEDNLQNDTQGLSEQKGVPGKDDVNMS